MSFLKELINEFQLEKQPVEIDKIEKRVQEFHRKLKNIQNKANAIIINEN